MEKKVVDVEELIKFRDALARLVEKPELFKEVAEAFEKDDAERFRDILRELGILRYCWLICRWLCVKKRGFVCVVLCPKPRKPEELTADEMLEFGRAAVRLMEKEDDFKALFDAYKRRDAEKFQSILREYKIIDFCVQFCRWFTHYYCRLKCRFFCPPTAKITSPSGLACVQPGPNKVDDETVVGVEIRGIASGGAPFLNYKLEYSSDGGSTWRQDAPGSGDIIIVYPDGHRGGVSTTPVGPPPNVLGYLDSTNLSPATYHIKLTVTGGGITVTDTVQFQLHQKPVVIDEVGRIAVVVKDSARKLILDNKERAVGGYATIGGSAKVEGCGHRYKKYKLMMAKGWITPTPGVDYDTIGPPWEVLKDRYGNDIEIDYTGKPVWTLCFLNQPVGDLSVKWDKCYCLRVPGGIPLGPPLKPFDCLKRAPWQTVHPVKKEERTGKYTILLAVQDDATPPNTYFDSLQVWLDNIAIDAMLDSIGIPGKKVNKCKPLSIKEILESGGILEIKGTAWDDEIESGNLTQPSLNFDHFDVRWKKDCDPSYRTDGIELLPKPKIPPPPPPPEPGKQRIKNDTLATWDIREKDPATGKPTGKPLPGIEPCAYVIQLRVWDNSRINDDGPHYDHKELAFTLES